MKRIGILLLALLLCGGLFACAQVQNAQDAFSLSAEGAMIGRTFREVEEAFGPLSQVVLTADEPAAYLFTGTGMAFHFDAPQTRESWASLLTEGVGTVPAETALQSIRPEDVCAGVSGPILDFGVAESDVNELAKYLESLDPVFYETAENTVYAVTTPDGAYDVFVYCDRGTFAFTAENRMRVMAAEARDEAEVTEFSFGGSTVRVGETKVEVRGTAAARRTVTAQEIADLVRYCPQLRSLTLDYCDVAGEARIGLLTELTSLEIMSSGVRDVSFVKGLNKLTHLSLCHNDISDLTALEGLKLTYLNLGDNPRLGNDSLKSVGKITTLETLYLYSLSISSLSPLQTLSELGALNLNSDGRIDQADLTKLSKLPKLHSLQISHTGVTSLDFLITKFPYLRELEARKLSKLTDPIQSCFKLAEHPRLKKLVLSKTVREDMDAKAQANYGMTAADWFKSQGITLSFK